MEGKVGSKKWRQLKNQTFRTDTKSLECLGDVDGVMLYCQRSGSQNTFRWFYRHITHTYLCLRLFIRQDVNLLDMSEHRLHPFLSNGHRFGIFFNKYHESMDLHHLGSMFFPSYIFLSLVGCRNSSQSFHLIVTPRLARWKA